MKLSVTIATWKRPELLAVVLNALVKQTTSHTAFEVIVCDSKSGADTDWIVAQCQATNPTFNLRHVHTDNILAAKRNIGVAAARHEIVVFLDDDCVPENQFVEKYISYFSKIENPKTVLCGEVNYPSDWVARSNYFRFRHSRHFGSGRRPELEVTKLDCRTIVVMNMGFLKYEYETAGLFVNENFVGYGCEDHEFGYRLNQQGFTIFPTDIAIEHRETSGSLGGYKKKLFHTSRDGVATLLRENPAVIEAIGATSLENPTTVWYGRALVALLKSPLVNIIESILKATDKLPFFYCPPGYKIVLARAYLDGKDNRSAKLDKKNSSTGWYQ